METIIKEIGQSLVQYAEESAVFSAQRGITEELFPYIYQASRRMSTRAISTFLKETHKVKLSAVTIAKALREADKHWLALFESVEPAALVFGEAHGNMSAEAVLELSNEEFEALRHSPPTLAMHTNEQASANYDAYQNAAAVLGDDWFAFDQDIRETCLGSIPAEEPEEPDEGLKEKKES